MTEQRLREAFELMKQGEKNQAMMLVRGVLRENPQNIDAWWLMANLLEDEDKILKSLNQVLELNPEHPGARKKLASIRPDLAENLAPVDDATKQKTDDAYWAKLKNPAQAQQKNGLGSTILGVLGVFGARLGFRLVILVIILAVVGIVSLFNNISTQMALPDDNGDTPQKVVEEFMIAMWKEDADTLYRLSCPEYYPEVDLIVGDFWGGDYSNSIVDTSETDFDLYYYSGDQAYVTIKGSMTFIDGSEKFTLDWNEDARLEGYDFYGEHVYRTNGVWQVCVSRYVPDLEED